jgi:CRISPR-associated protein Cmx8
MTRASAVDRGPAQQIHGLVRSYVFRRTESKSGIKWDDFKDRKIVDSGTGRARIDVPPKYREAREKVCTEAFLRLRACRSREDFVGYFTGTICSVPQYLPPAEYDALSRIVLDENRWEDAKALAMLALSALSGA